MDLVVSDVVPLGCAAASAAGVPSVCVSNFSWGGSTPLNFTGLGQLSAASSFCSSKTPAGTPPSEGSGYFCRLHLLGIPDFSRGALPQAGLANCGGLCQGRSAAASAWLLPNASIQGGH